MQCYLTSNAPTEAVEERQAKRDRKTRAAKRKEEMAAKRAKRAADRVER